MSADAPPVMARSASRSRGPLLIAAAIVCAFALRLAFGLVSDFWGDDEVQIFLIGLKFYATGEWPYYGPDVVYTETQVPGALQGLLVGGPFWIVARPESPFVLLNVLTLSALLLLGWYIGRRVPAVPRWFLWLTVLFSPWTLDVSTHIINTAYLLVGAIVFVVSAFEIVPSLRLGVMSRGLAGFGMGFGALWVAQVHLSAAILVPLGVIAFLLAARDDVRSTARALGWCLAGAMAGGATLLPTLLVDGASVVASRTGENVVLNPGYLLRFPQIVIQFFSLATFELPRFVGPSTGDRVAFLRNYPWAAPAALFAAACGTVQVVVLVIELFRSHPERAGWAPVRRVTIGALLLLGASFMFSVKEPVSHAFYVLLPLAMIYAFYVWAPLLQRRPVRIIAAVLCLAGGITHVALAMKSYHERSMYPTIDRVVRAVQEKNYRLIGERRTDAWKK